MKRKLFIILSLVIISIFVLVACDGGGGPKESAAPTDTPVPTDTPLPTDTPVPTDTPEPDPDSDVNALLYRFAYEGEDIYDTVFSRAGLGVMFSIHEMTEEGLEITVIDGLAGLTDPYFYLPLNDGALDLAEYPIFKMIVKSNSKNKTGEFYMAFDEENIEGTAQHYTYTFAKTDDWQEIYLDLSKLKKGAEYLTKLRMDILGQPDLDSTIVIDFCGFFPSREAAEEYLPPNRRNDGQ